MKKILIPVFTLCVLAAFGQDASPYTGKIKEEVYKKTDAAELKLYLYYPEKTEEKACPAIIFFFGGGWTSGNIGQFKPHAEYFAQRGMIGILADYRVKSRHGTTPVESVTDAKSAMRFLRSNADRLHIDPDRIVASGGSAGGHLAAATATIEKYNDEQDDLTVSPRPNALVLFNPAIDLGPGGIAFEWVGENYLYLSPLYHIRAGVPPTVFFLGAEDKLIPVETARYYKKIMERTGNRCDLYLYEGQSHGFFNFKNPEYYRQTVAKADEFLVSLGFLNQL
jgi:acetyl esterase/lipase